MCPQRLDFAIKRRKNKFSPQNFLRIPKIYLETRKKQNKYFGPRRRIILTDKPYNIAVGQNNSFCYRKAKN